MERRVFETATPDKLDYLLWTPTDLREDERLPLLIFLHGAGERGPVIDRLYVNGIPKIFSGEHPYRCVVVAPQCPAEETWFPYLHELHALILHTIAQQHCDPARVSLTGLSMGGYGTWELAMAYPELFSAIAPICGGGASWRSSLLKDLPIRVFHGSADDAVPVERSIEMVNAVRRAGGEVEFTIYHGAGHDVWTKAYEGTDLIAWLLSQKKKG
ncbi:MAG: prolyl oligopeptidase family serine peptidase [Clostridiaceae bacterium]|nr:prolyl oligopeptidase family serine peptidase [Clostridiaceae bacterium]